MGGVIYLLSLLVVGKCLLWLIVGVLHLVGLLVVGVLYVVTYLFVGGWCYSFVGGWCDLFGVICVCGWLVWVSLLSVGAQRYLPTRFNVYAEAEAEADAEAKAAVTFWTEHTGLGDATQLAAPATGYKQRQTGRLDTEEGTTGSFCSCELLKPV